MSSSNPRPLTEMDKFISRLILVAFILLMATIVGIATCNNGSGKNGKLRGYVKHKPRPKQIIYVTAEELNGSYQANEVAANDYYKGQKIQLRGIVTRISEDFTGQPYVTLATGQMFQEIHCEISRLRAAKTEKGQMIIVFCHVKGMVMGNVVVIEDQPEN